MTIQEEYELSCYEELAKIKENKSVYLVRHIDTGRVCVKKRIDVYNETVYLKLKETKLGGMPQIHFCAEQNGKLVVIEDYIQGRSLQDIYETEGPFSEKQVSDIARTLCDILQRLHQCTPPIIHRDIKPSNIMRSDDGVIKLIDFNAAKEFAEGKTEDTQFIGTHDFAAPEQYGFGQSDARTDIYAVGVSMNYLLTGAVPREKLYCGALGEVIQKCTRLDAADRYQSVGELRKALENSNAAAVREKAGKRKEKQGKDPEGISGEEQTKKGLYKRKAFLPVGFRTGTIWKMLTAVFGYWLLAYSCMEMTVSDKEGQELVGRSLWVNRWGALILFLGYLYYIGNYLNIRTRATAAAKSKKTRLLLSVLYLFLYSVFVTMMIVFLE